MSAFYHDSTDVNDDWQREVAAIRLIAKLPTIAAMAYKYSVVSHLCIRAMIWIMRQTSCICVFRFLPKNTV